MWSSHSITSKRILLDWYLAIFSEPVQTAISGSCSEGSPVPRWLKHLQILASDASSLANQFVDNHWQWENTGVLSKTSALQVYASVQHIQTDSAL